MLIHLAIHQFALVEHLDLSFTDGMVVITGETGAGKSILLDALGLALGQRAEANCVRQGGEQADIIASFQCNDSAIQWLHERDMPHDDTLILRRVVSAEGRSRAYINGRPVAASDLKDIAKYLIEVHSQHAHQHLLDKDSARSILDAYGNLHGLQRQVRQAYDDWQSQAQRLSRLQTESAEIQAQKQLLTYQVEELRELNLGEDEIEQLELEQKRLASAESVLLSGQQALSACLGDETEGDAAAQLTWQALTRVEQVDDPHPALQEAKELLQQAHIQLEEAGSSLRRYLEQVDINPHRLQQVEARLSQIFTMARKHHMHPNSLYEHWQDQEQALAELSLSAGDLDDLLTRVEQLQQQYAELAQSLSTQRHHYAQQLDQAIMSHFDSLSLGRAKFQTHIKSLDISRASRTGIDQIEFHVQTNPGMPFGPLAKVASGGELSRISLAIQVVTAATCQTPSLIFDEVDVGIGGGTAERVGRLMRRLGESHQVMCVTHQPQVAAQAHQHYQVSKISGEQATHTRIRELNNNQRTEELARMLGGVDITQQTLAHAQEMLSLAQ